MDQDPLKSKFVEHVLKYRPDSVTAQLAKEVESLRALRRQTLSDINRLEDKLVGFMYKNSSTTREHYEHRVEEAWKDVVGIMKRLFYGPKEPR